MPSVVCDLSETLTNVTKNQKLVHDREATPLPTDPGEAFSIFTPKSHIKC